MWDISGSREVSGDRLFPLPRVEVFIVGTEGCGKGRSEGSCAMSPGGVLSSTGGVQWSTVWSRDGERVVLQRPKGCNNRRAVPLPVIFDRTWRD